MRIDDIQIFEGRNVFSHRPAARVTLNLGVLSGKESSDYPGFSKALLQYLPGLNHHACSGNLGGFATRLQEGTYFGHIFEHVVLELQCLLGFDIRFGKTRELLVPGKYDVVFEYGSAAVVTRMCRLALEVINGTLVQHSVAISEKLDEMRELVAQYALGPSTQAIVDAAKKRGISVRRIGTGSLIQLGSGKHMRRVQASISPHTSCIAADIACNKELTKHILASAGIPVPYGLTVVTAAEAVEAAEKIGGPVVVKPIDGNQGKGVSLRLVTPAQIQAAFKAAYPYSPKVIVEEHIEGRHYRLLTVAHRLVAAAERIPAHVDGDGNRSVGQLVERANDNPLRGHKHEKPLTKISIDDVTMAVLANQSLTIDSIPEKGLRVYLRDSANLSTGECTFSNDVHLSSILIHALYIY